MNNSNKLVRSAIYGQLPIFVSLISGLVLMPKMIRYFGDQYYGLWVLVGTFLGYFGLLDFGFSKAIVRYVSRALGRNDKEESDGWLTLGILFLLASSILGIIFLVTILWSLKYFVTKDLDLIRTVISIAGFAFLIVLPSKGFIGLLQAHVRGDILDSILATVGLLRIVVFLIALYFELSFIEFIYLLAISTLIEGIFISIYALKIHGELRIRMEWINKDNIKKFIDYSGFSFIAQLTDLFRFQAYPLIISTFLGLAAITPFQIANRLRMILGQIHNKVLINFTPVFSQIEGRGIKGELKQAYFFSYKISSYFVAYTVGITALIAPAFINRWMGPDYNESIIILLVALISNLAAGIQAPTVNFLFATDKQRFYALSNSIEALLIIGSAIILIKYYGLIGMIIGASASTFIVKIFVQPLWVGRDLKFSLCWFHINKTIPQALKIFLFLIVPYYASDLILKPTYMSIVFFGIVTSLIFIPYIWLVGFSKGERKTLFNSLPFLKRSNLVRKIFNQ